MSGGRSQLYTTVGLLSLVAYLANCVLGQYRVAYNRVYVEYSSTNGILYVYGWYIAQLPTCNQTGLLRMSIPRHP